MQQWHAARIAPPPSSLPKECVCVCFAATACPENVAGCAFSGTFDAREKDGGPAPVDEPDTLTLMVGGAIR
jgi:hypothetical protein